MSSTFAATIIVCIESCCLCGAFIALAASYSGLPVTALLAWYASLVGLLVLGGIGAVVLVSAILLLFERLSASPQDTAARIRPVPVASETERGIQKIRS